MDGLTVNNLRYADDAVLIAKTEADVRCLLDIVVCESDDQSLSLNAEKTVSMVISGKEMIPTCNFKIHNKQVKQVDKFYYLGSYITSNGHLEYDIKCRIAQGKQAFIQLDNILTSGKITWRTRCRILNSHVWCVMI